MGERIRTHDWTGSPLGHPGEWPQALKTLVALMLASEQPMFMAWGPEQTWLYNDAFVPILGTKHPQALGRHALGEVWSEGREVLAPLFERVFAGEPVHMDDFGLMLDRNGRLEEAHFAFSYTPVRDESGSVAGLFGACIETTDKILASRRELAALERQRRMFEQAPSFVCMLGGPDHVFEFVNRAHRELFGSGGWIGKPIREAFSEIAGQGFYELLDQVYRSGKRYVAEEERIRFRRTPGGAMEERLLTFIYEPVLDESGTVTGIFCDGSDVTEMHRTQRALRESEAQLQFLDGLGLAIRDCADSRAILAVTTRRLGEYLGVGGCSFGHVEADGATLAMRGDWAKDGVAGVCPLEAFGAAAGAILVAGKPFVVNDVAREMLPGPIGDTFTRMGIQAIVCWAHAQAGRLVALLAVFQAAPRAWSEREIALVAAVVERSWAHVERIKAQEKLREADRRKDEFLAMLAHELRNPLAPLRNALYLARTGAAAGGGSSQAEMLHGMMERQVNQMVRLVDDLLDVARITQGKIALRLEPVEIRRVVSSAVETTAPTVKQAGHEVAVSVPSCATYVQGDAVRLIQVLLNLINNAVKFSQPGENIQLTVTRDGDEVVLAVKDRGMGIPADKLEEVFEMFSQLDRSLERSRTGLGLGLALAREIVKMHGGTIRASSAGPGLGSEFTVRLPVLSSSAPGPESSVPAQGIAAERRKVLIADDNHDAADSMGLLLRAAGHDVEVVYDGLEALEVARRLRPDVIVLDIGMPGLNGYDLARAARLEPWSAETVIIALTGWGQDSDKQRSRGAQIDLHLVKPVERDVLEKAVLGRRGDRP